MKNLIQTFRRFLLSFIKPKIAYKVISTKDNWRILKLSNSIKVQLEELENKLCTKTGCTCVFYGSNNTQFDTVAALLGEHSAQKVYKIDSSVIVSKYIGETEKNLNWLFEKAENMDWILFFDETDALFEKRTDIEGFHDKGRNLSIDYLIRKIEKHPGKVILATNKKASLDHPFIKKVNYIINFDKTKNEN